VVLDEAHSARRRGGLGQRKEEARYLHTIVEELLRPEAHDPKFNAVKYFLTSYPSEGKTWRNVDMLNLVYHEIQDEKVYKALSRKMKDRYDIFGGLPDTIDRLSMPW